MLAAGQVMASGYVMKLHPVTAKPGETILVELEIINEGSFTGFNLDIPLPQGFTYVAGSFQLNPDRRNGHTSAASVRSGNVLRILSYSMSNAAYHGNDGVIGTFSVVASETPGTYLMDIVDAVIAGTGTGNLLTGTEPGIVTLQEGFTLTLNISGNGAVTVDGNLYTAPVTVEENTTLTLVAQPDPGYQFDQWGGDLSGTELTKEVVMDGNKGVSASFSVIPSGDNVLKVRDASGYTGQEVEIELEIENEDEFVAFSADVAIPAGFTYVEGSATLNTNRAANHILDATLVSDNLLRLIAISTTNAAFSGSQGVVAGFTLIGSDTPGTYPITLADGVISNQFAIDILSAKADGEVSLVEPPPTYVLTYLAGANGSIVGEAVQEVEEGKDGNPVEAVADTGYHFARWSDGDTDNPRTDTNVQADLTVTANFDPNTYNIVATAVPAEGGSISGAGEHAFGTQASLEAESAEGFEFIKWTENGTRISRSETLEFTVTGDRNLEAHFSQHAVNIAVAANPVAGGTVQGAGNYLPGDMVTLVATPATGYRFASWTSAGVIVSTSATYNFEANTDKELTANFSPLQYTVSLQTEPAGGLGGLVKGGGTFAYGTEITVLAGANRDYEFVGWKEGSEIVSTQANYTFQVTANRTLVAQFEGAIYTITAGVEPDETGTVTGTGNYLHGQVVSLEAEAAEGYYLLRWMEGTSQVSVRNPYKFSATANRSLTAEFAQKWWNDDKQQKENNVLITASVEPEGTGVVLGQGYYEIGEEVTLVASPNEGIEFTAWTEDGEIILDANDEPVGATYVFTATVDRQLVAVFDGEVYTITVAAEPEEGGEVSVSGEGKFFAGDFAELTATANPGYVFERWTIGLDGPQLSANAEYGFTVTEDADLVAHFEPVPEYTLTLTAEPEDGGTVSGAGTYAEGTEVSISATEADGYRFLYWREGAEVFSENPDVDFIINRNMELEAWFELIVYQVRFDVVDVGGDPITDAVVTFDGYEADPGQYVFENVVPGIYTYIISKDGYFSVQGELELIDEDVVKLVEIRVDDTSVVPVDEMPVSQVYPNPARDVLQINASVPMQEIRLVDMVGRIVYTASPHAEQASIQVTEYKPGIYLLQLRTHAGVETIRIQISR